MSWTVRPERPLDVDAIHAVNAAAFPTALEADLVDALRAAGALTLSLVATESDSVVGHIAFSPVTVTRADGTTVTGVGLGPMAVLPRRQRAGAGSALVEEGLRRLRALGARFCVVLGHPDYYPRFGFAPASGSHLRWEHPAPDEAFLAVALTPGGLDGVTGVVRYRPEFDVDEPVA